MTPLLKCLLTLILIIAVVAFAFCIWLREDAYLDGRQYRSAPTGPANVQLAYGVEELFQRMKLPDPELRAAAVMALGETGFGNAMTADVVRALSTALQDSDWRVRLAAAVSLGNGGSQAGDAVSGLVVALKDRSMYVRSSAAFALGKIGAKAQEAVPALAKALHDNNEGVRREAAAALHKLGH